MSTVNETSTANIELKTLSIVVPLFNESEVFPELLQRLLALAEQFSDIETEFVFVDDGSVDSTWTLIMEAHRRDARVRGISLSRNFGQQAAFTAGMDIATGHAVVLMDGDLQDDPHIVGRLIEKFKQGFEVVAVKRNSRNAPLLLRIAYRLFYRVLALLSSTDITLDSGDFSILSARVVRALRNMPEHHRFLRGLRSWVGFRQTAIDVDRPARVTGQSKFTLTKLLRLAADGLFSFSLIPLRLATLAGIITIVFALAMSAYWVYLRLATDLMPSGFTATVVFLCLIGGTHLMFLGVIGEYVGRIYEQSKARPHYLSRESIGLPHLAPAPVTNSCFCRHCGSRVTNG